MGLGQNLYLLFGPMGPVGRAHHHAWAHATEPRGMTNLPANLQICGLHASAKVWGIQNLQSANLQPAYME